MRPVWVRSDNEVLATLQDVVAIESINPDLHGEGRGEVGMVEYLVDFFDAARIPYETYEVLPGRSNIIATLEGERPEDILLFEFHMDTKPVGVMSVPPFEPHIRDNLLYGHGACDTKAGGVAMMHAMRRIKKARIKPTCTIKLAGVVDEAYLFRGAAHLASTVKANAVVVSGPTGLKIVRAHNGLVRFRIVANGEATHNTRPHFGINAISRMARIILTIEEEIDLAYLAKSHPLTGRPLFKIGVISGGRQVNSVHDQCFIEIDRWITPSETLQETLEPFNNLLSQLKGDDPDLNVTLEKPVLFNAPMEVSKEAPIVKLVADSCSGILGTSTITGSLYASDASKFTQAGVPAIVFGPGGIDQAQIPIERIACKEVLNAVDVYQQMMIRSYTLLDELPWQ